MFLWRPTAKIASFMMIAIVPSRRSPSLNRCFHERRHIRAPPPSRAFGVDVRQFEGAMDPETGYAVVYGGLGVMATSFLATFFVAPKFSTELKESEDWKDIYVQLVNKETQSIAPEAANTKLKNAQYVFSGVYVCAVAFRSVLLDVSLESKYNKQSAKGSINIPLYQPIQGWDAASIARRAGFTFFGIPGTERNPSWLKTVEGTILKDSEVIVMCELGGSLEKKVGMDTGFQSRSLKAIHLLQQAGYENVLHLKGGITEWMRSGLPMNEQQDE